MSNDYLERRLLGYLRDRFSGRIVTDLSHLDRYSTDRSIFRVRPQAVLFPRTVEDIAQALTFSRMESIPITPRSGGTSTGGSAIGSGILLVLTDVEELSRVEVVGAEEGRLVVRAGASVRHDHLQSELARRGYFLPSDPTSGPISYLGGNIAARASGPHALKHGSIDAYLRGVEAVTIDGSVIDTDRPESIPAHIRDGIDAVGNTLRESSELRTLLERRSGLKSASGYALDTLLEPALQGRKTASLMCGQSGTLAVVTRGTLEALPALSGTANALLGFDSAESAFDAVPFVNEFQPEAIEFMNRSAMQISREKGRYPAAARGAVEMATRFAAVLLVELAGPDAEDRMQQLAAAVRDGRIAGLDSFHGTTSDAEREAIWTARKGLMPAVHSYSPTHRALSVVNDVGVPVGQLSPFLREAEALFARLELTAPIYGHAGNGNLHLRPLFDLRRQDIRSLVRQVADEIYGMVVSLGGTVTGEHGMGRLRAPYLRSEWGDRAYEIMRRIKMLFDPDDLLNPGVMFTDRNVFDDIDLG